MGKTTEINMIKRIFFLLGQSFRKYYKNIFRDLENRKTIVISMVAKVKGILRLFQTVHKVASYY